MFGNNILNEDISASSRRDRHKRPRLNLVGNYAVSHTVQFFYAAYFDNVSTRADNIRAH